MRFKCSMCEAVFQSTTAPTQCPKCKGTGEARYGKNKMPAKRLTNKQRKQIAALDPELVKAFREAQAREPEGGVVQVRVIPEPATPEPPPGMIYGECRIKI